MEKIRSWKWKVGRQKYRKVKRSSREDSKIEDEASLEDRKSVKCKEAEENKKMSCRRKLVEKEKQVTTTLDSSIQDRKRR